jgi:hypothetical protein
MPDCSQIKTKRAGTSVRQSSVPQPAVASYIRVGCTETERRERKFQSEPIDSCKCCLSENERNYESE